MAPLMRSMVSGHHRNQRLSSPWRLHKGMFKKSERWFLIIGAAARIRTGDLRITNALLYQLSYSGGNAGSKTNGRMRGAFYHDNPTTRFCRRPRFFRRRCRHKDGCAEVHRLHAGIIYAAASSAMSSLPSASSASCSIPSCLRAKSPPRRHSASVTPILLRQ